MPRIIHSQPEFCEANQIKQHLLPPFFTNCSLNSMLPDTSTVTQLKQPTWRPPLTSILLTAQLVVLILLGLSAALSLTCHFWNTVITKSQGYCSLWVSSYPTATHMLGLLCWSLLLFSKFWVSQFSFLSKCSSYLISGNSVA